MRNSVFNQNYQHGKWLKWVAKITKFGPNHHKMAPILSSKLYQNKYQLFKCIIPKHANLAAKNATKIFTIFCLSVSFSSNLTECICEECNFMSFCFFHLHHQHLHAVCYAFSCRSLFQSVTATENDNGAKIGKFFFVERTAKPWYVLLEV